MPIRESIKSQPEAESKADCAAVEHPDDEVGFIAQPVHFWTRLWSLMFAGGCFVLFYNFSNWLTAQRHGVSEWMYGWESSIPFLPWTILPYWSIDLLFVGAFFLCSTRIQLARLTRRVVAVQLVSVIGFLLFPLQNTHVPTSGFGLFAGLYQTLFSFDKPYNQAPSLHIGLLVIFWAFYHQQLTAKSTGQFHRWIVRLADLWFALIGVSVLTTGQHHVIDLFWGALVGCACQWWGGLHLDPLQIQRPRHFFIPVYGCISALLIVVSFLLPPLSPLSGWMVVSLMTVAANYAWFGWQGFGKQSNGRFGIVRCMLLLPFWFVQCLQRAFWRWKVGVAVRLAPGLSVGSLPLSSRQSLYTMIVDMSCDYPIWVRHPHYHLVPWMDLQIPEAADLERLWSVLPTQKTDGEILICCTLGFYRSLLASSLLLVKRGDAGSILEAEQIIRRSGRKCAVPAAHFLAVHRWFEAYRHDYHPR